MIYCLFLKGLPGLSRRTNDLLNAYSMHQRDHELRDLPGQAHLSVSAIGMLPVLASLPCCATYGYHSKITVLSTAVSRASMKNRDIGVFPI
jgi:hypothetical protein